MRSILFSMGNLLVRNADGVAGGGAAPAPAPAASSTPASAVLAEPAPAPASAAAPPAAEPAPASPSDNSWYSTLSKDVQDVLNTKGWKSLPANEALETVANSYVNLERLFGADKAGNTVQVPKADATPEERRMFYSKLGVPEEAAGYELKVPEELAEMPLFAKASDWFHQVGVPKDLANALVEKVIADEQAMAKQYEQKSQQEWQDLQGEWRDKFDDQVELARRASKMVGWDQNTLASIERTIGTKALMQAMARVGSNLLEAEAPAPGTGAGTFRVTPQMAADKIEGMFKDSEFMSRYLSPNPAVREKAVGEMETLMKIKGGA